MTSLFDPTTLSRYGRLSLIARNVVAGFLSGVHKSPYKGFSVEFAEHRQYYPGDEIRHMDWRGTARSGKPHTKVFQEEREQGVLFVIDLNPGMRFGTKVRFKNVQAARAAALLAWMASAAGDRANAIR